MQDSLERVHDEVVECRKGPRLVAWREPVGGGKRAGVPGWWSGGLYRAGYANQPTSCSRDDGLELHGACISACVRCAPPGNRPTLEERDNCLPYLERELRLLKSVRVIVCLGKFAYDGVAPVARLRRRAPLPPRGETGLPDGRYLVCSFHPSQQNTFTRKLTVPMFDAIFARARELARARK